MQPWFQCESCGETLKKPKVLQHATMCGSSCFTCIDCSRQFDRRTVQNHTSCVTEHQKYALGATKPGGYAAKGYYNDTTGNAATAATAATDDGDVVGMEFLSNNPPWKCSLCNVVCTSQDTLLSHAQGAKHKRRARAALASSSPQKENTNADKNGLVKQESDTKPGSIASKEKEEGKKIKWKKLAVKELKKNNGSMKTKELLSALLNGHDKIDSDAVLKKLKKKSNTFIFDKKTVSLIF